MTARSHTRSKHKARRKAQTARLVGLAAAERQPMNEHQRAARQAKQRMMIYRHHAEQRRLSTIFKEMGL